MCSVSHIHEPKWLSTKYLFFGSLFNPRIYFLLVNLVCQTNNILGIRDVFAILIHLETIVTAPHKFRDHSGCLLGFDFCSCELLSVCDVLFMTVLLWFYT